MELNMILTLVCGLAVLLVLVAFVLVKERTAYLGPVKEELQKEKMWLRRGEYNAAMVKGRQNLELLLKLVAEKNGIQLDNTAQAVANAREEEERQSQSGQKKQKGRKKERKVMTHHQFNRWLAENGYLDRVAKWEMNQVRLIGNKAVHENYADKDDAWNQYNYLEDILKTVTEKSQNPKKHHERHGDAQKKAEGKKYQNGQKGGNAQKDPKSQKGQKGGNAQKDQKSQKGGNAQKDSKNQKGGNVQKDQNSQKSGNVQKDLKGQKRGNHQSIQKGQNGEQVQNGQNRKKDKHVLKDANNQASGKVEHTDKTENLEISAPEKQVQRKKRRRRKPQSAQQEQPQAVKAAEVVSQSEEKTRPTNPKREIRSFLEQADTIEPAESTSPEHKKKRRRRRRRRKPQSNTNGPSAADTVVPEDKNEIV